MLLGERVNNAKLTEGDVREIRRLSGRLTQKALAERFGVSQPAIHSVVSGKTWRHV
jgi:predicted transcriptional regulator